MKKKKAALETILKPLIERIVEQKIHSLLLEEGGLLSRVITEVTSGFAKQHLHRSTVSATPAPVVFERETRRSPAPVLNQAQIKKQEKQELRRKVLSEVAKNAYKGVDIFEGTKSILEEEEEHSVGVSVETLSKLGLKF